MSPTPHPSCPQAITKLIEAQGAIQLELWKYLGNTAEYLEGGLSLAVALQDASPETLDSFQTGLRSFFLSDSPFAARNVRKVLDDLLAKDLHLKACCRTAWGLARTIELLAPIALRRMDRPWDEGGQDTAVGRMLGVLYEAEYKREIYIHLYNFDLEHAPFGISMLGAEVVRLSAVDLPRLIGEVGFTSALHDPKTGTCFVKFTDNGSDDDNATFQRCWIATSAIVQIFKYLKDGILDIDYGGIYYAPAWVNEVMRAGIRIWGLPRKDAQKQLYFLQNKDRQTLEVYCKAYQKLKPLIENTSSSLRQATALAGNYFEDYHKRVKVEEKLIDLVIALEILFSPSREGELRFRIAQRAAILLGGTPMEREEIRDFILRIYDARSALVHSGESPFSTAAKRKLTEDDLSLLAKYVRQAILRLFIFHWRGETEKQKVQELLDKCALDHASQSRLFSDTDFDSALSEILSSSEAEHSRGIPRQDDIKGGSTFLKS